MTRDWGVITEDQLRADINDWGVITEDQLRADINDWGVITEDKLRADINCTHSEKRLLPPRENW